MDEIKSRRAKATREPLQPPKAGGELPARLTAVDMMGIFNVKKTRFYELQTAGKFRRFELRPKVGCTAYSGRLVQRYLDGESLAKRDGLAKTA